MLVSLVLAGVAGIALVVAVVLALRFPVAAVAVSSVAAVLPSVILSMDFLSEGWDTLPGGVRVQDLTYVVLLAATFVHLSRGTRRKRGDAILQAVSTAFAAWLVLEVVRNVDTHGIAAAGELRFRYLSLAVPAFVATVCWGRSTIHLAMRVVVWLSLGLPLAIAPFVAYRLSWYFGPESRLFPASISAGILYGLNALLIGRRAGIFRMPDLLLVGVTVGSLVLIIVDSHRSVWTAGAAILVLGVTWGDHRFKIASRWFVPALLVGCGSVALLKFLGIDLVEFVTTRGAAVFDPMSERNASWRIAIWRSAWERITASPLTGEGFGGYWDLYVPELGGTVTATPHSLYVQTAVKLGLIGIGLYLAVVGRVWMRFARFLRQPIAGDRITKAIVWIAMSTLIGSHVFFGVYALDHWAWIYVALGLAQLGTVAREHC